MLETLITHIGEKIGLPELALDEHNLCRLTFDDQWTIDLEALPEEGLFFLYAPVCKLPHKGGGAFFAALLSANLFGRETGGFAHFGLDEERGEILLFSRFETEKITKEEFEKILAIFVDRIEFWTGQAGALAEKAAWDEGDQSDNPDWMLRV